MSEHLIMGDAPQRDGQELGGGIGTGLRPVGKSQPCVAAVLAAWYRIRERLAAREAGASAMRGGTGRGERILLACSGGADSSALVLAMSRISSARQRLVVGHVMHDLRPRHEAAADRDRVVELARVAVPGGLALGEAAVAVAKLAGNAEGNARRARYAALAALAAEHGCGVVMTGHTRDDQAETVLMRLMRGAGPRGLAAMPECRRMPKPAGPAGSGLAVAGGTELWLVRPMLTVGGEAARAMCEAAGWRWCQDATNADVTRLRAVVRHRVLPLLESISAGSTERIAAAAGVQRGAAAALGVMAAEWQGGRAGPPWKRRDLALLRPGLVAEILLRACRDGGGGLDGSDGPSAGADRVRRKAVEAAVAAICGGVSRTKWFDLGGARVRVSGGEVGVEGRSRDARCEGEAEIKD